MWLVPFYSGDGKGKTTAAVGLAVRAAGAGRKVIFTQFLKDGSSSETAVLSRTDNIELCVCRRRFGFFAGMTEEEKRQAVLAYSALLDKAFQKAAAGAGLLVLDEAVSACRHGIIDETKLIELIQNRPEKLEIALTGRNPSGRLCAIADYISEIQKIRHPFDRGVAARKGIEY